VFSERARELEISQRITVKRRTAFTRSNDFYIEKVAHSVDADTGMMWLGRSPTTIVRVTVFVAASITDSVPGLVSVAA